jgi:hypothetical protein
MALTALLIVAVLVGLANLGCTVFVVIKLYQDKGIVHALVGFFVASSIP